MTQLEKVTKGLTCCVDYRNKNYSLCDDITCPYRTEPMGHCQTIVMKDALELLEKQKQIKSPNEFKSLLLGMFDSIWDVEIDHPVFQDTVGELMEGVLQAYSEAVKWE